MTTASLLARAGALAAAGLSLGMPLAAPAAALTETPAAALAQTPAQASAETPPRTSVQALPRVPAPAPTQAPAPRQPAAAPSLAQAIEAAWLRAVDHADARAQARQAQAGRAAASSLWAAPPVLELSHRSDGWQSNRGVRESELALALPLWRPGQRDARAQAGEAEARAAEAAAAAARLRVAARVCEAAWDIRLQQAETELAQAQADALQKLAQDVTRRVAAGDLARADALAARAELHAATAALTQARGRLHAASLQWAALTGLSTPPDLQVPHATPPSPPPAGTRHPALEQAEWAVEAAQRRLALAQASRRGPPELVARLRRDVAGHAEPAANSLGLALRLPLGSEAHSGPPLAQALSDLELAQAGLQRTQDQLQADAEIARAAEQAALAQMADEGERAALLRERAGLLEASFRAGETALPDLLRALAAAAQADAARQRQQADAGLARARLQLSLGQHP